MGRKIYKIEGIDCPNCALQMETLISNIKDFKEVNFNFANERLILNTELDDISVMNIIQTILDKNEPGAKIYNKERFEVQEKKEKTSNIVWIRLGISLCIMLFYFLFKSMVPELVNLVLLIVVYVISSIEPYIIFSNNIHKLNIFDENFLMIIASLGAILIGQIPEACFVMIFYSLGEELQELAVKNSRRSIEKTIKLRPEQANLLQNGNFKLINPRALKVDDIILIKPGERIPVDCEVIEGNSLVDTKAMTGESAPLNAEPGIKLISGCINWNSSIKAKVLATYENSAVAKMLEIVENAAAKKAKTEKFITRFARIYTPFVVISAIFIAIIPALLFNQNLDTWIYRALIFLVASCPCALILSVPLTYFAGIGSASTKGILVKGGVVLEKLGLVKRVLLDKTGTLTEGTFEVIDIHSFTTEKELFDALYFSEIGSNHPIAKAIINYVTNYVEKARYSEWQYEDVPGKGVIAKNNNTEIIVGKIELLKDYNINVDKVNSQETVIYVAKNNNYIGYVLLGDTIRNEAKPTIDNLKKLGIDNIGILTGDRKEVAEKVASSIGINSVRAELLPEQKYNAFSEGDSKHTMYVGDGVNDAPVVLSADVGVALGGIGQDAVIEVADVVVTNDKLSSIPIMIKIGRKTRTIVLENIIFALGIKFLVLGLGIFGYSTLWMAVFADVGVSILAVLNALRMLRIKA